MYFYEITDNNITYSIDMLRLKTFITFDTFTRLQSYFDTVYHKYVAAFYTTAKMSSFFYNYHIVISENQSFWFGFLHNTEKRKERPDTLYNFTIEFNPNKLKDNNVLLYLLNLSLKWFLVSYDFAFDVKVHICDIIYNKNKKRHVEIFQNSFDDKTIRIGKNDGKIKIYNKKKESSLDVPYDLTRIEVSVQVNDIEILYGYNITFDKKYIPIIYLNNYIYSLSDYQDKTLLAVLYAIQNGFPYEYLSRTYKNKIKNLFVGGYSIDFDYKICTKVLRKVLSKYFRRFVI